MKGWSTSAKALATTGSICLAFVISIARLEAAAFHRLGFLPGGGERSEGLGVSADGQVVAGMSDSAYVSSPFGGEAVRWTAAGIQSLTSPHVQSYAQGVSADGVVVVGWYVNSGNVDEAFRWTSSGGIQGLGDLPGGFFYSSANAASADGSYVVGISTGTSGSNINAQPFRWSSATGMQSLGPLPGAPQNWDGEAFDVSADGSVVVGSNDDPTGARQAFRWTVSGGMQPLPVAGSTGITWASSISADGKVIGGWANFIYGQEAILWNNSVPIHLGDLPGGGFYSEVTAVSGDGRVVIGTSGAGGTFTTDFIWDAQHGMRELRSVLINDYGLTEIANWGEIFSAQSLSYDGSTIVGWGENPDGAFEAWIATVPEPSGVVLMAIGFAVGLPFIRLWRPKPNAQTRA